MPQPDSTPYDANDYFRVSVNSFWSSWTSGRLNDQRAFTGIRTALTELQEEPVDPPSVRHSAFHATVGAAVTDWEQGAAGEEDAMVRILDALLALDAASDTEASR